MTEVEIVEFFNHLGKGTFVDFASEYASWVFMIFIICLIVMFCVFFFDKKKGKIVVVTILIALVLHFAVTEFLIKNVVSDFTGIRERPYLAYPAQISAIGERSSDSSFPSSHMSGVTAFLGVLTYFYPAAWIVSLTVLFVMAFSRMHNGMHYPTDILAGILLGILYSAIAIYASKHFGKIRKLV